MSDTLEDEFLKAFPNAIYLKSNDFNAIKSDFQKWLKPVSHISEDRQQIINECRDVLLKQMFLMTHENDYPSEAVPKAIILSLPQLMKVSVTPVVENNNLLKAIEENAELKIANEELKEDNQMVHKILWEVQDENENLKKQLGEQIASAAMNNDALLELNRKIKDNIIDKAIQKCDEIIIEADKELSKGWRDEQMNLLKMRKHSYEEMKIYLQSLK